MANRRMNLSGTGKETLDLLCEVLEIDRPQGIKIALAKGIANATGKINDDFKDGKNKWTIPDNIIKDKEFLLFKHLIINEMQVALNEDEITQSILLYIEYGLKIIKQEVDNLSSLEDYRIIVLN
ncbi:hypothetical protein PDQ36_28185 [Bacillus cereus]|uniref:DUF1832 domain-containing protein n=1 Tax=Bacillus thuringiensis TaxID=1428 RepID=A0A0B5NN03_BACTU|nr:MULTISPECIES: hypothetical protein [Bacillus]AJG77755.1 hypothetical protein BF38_2170 [Bacillus thuringiensis]ANV73401.1 hypothetical protein BCM43_23915 [Bacillus thuringiensis]EEM74405.1 hypothetical protein bthur0010_55760 [Bacillus thuringiensis serovar pondicheriensis BGSC 4BA1]KAA0799769.1 hypothetical protein DN398_17380 [Bacillus sp. JAS102]KMQ06862.1 hypothetical protein TU68_08470 [Bacillus cereus]